MPSLYQSKENNRKPLEERPSSSPTTQWNRTPYGVQAQDVFSSVLPHQQAAADSPGPVSVAGEIAKPTEWHSPAVTSLNKNSQVSTSFDLNQQNKVLGRSAVVFTVDSIFPRWMPKFYSPLRCRKWFLADASTPRWRQVNYFYYAFWMVILPQTSFWHCYCTQYIPKEMTKLLQHLERDSCLYRQSPGILPLGREIW